MTRPRRIHAFDPDFIPFWDSEWYATTATQQISVRIPIDLVKFADAQIEDGRARGRADVVTAALERERRHRVALADAAVYRADRREWSDGLDDDGLDDDEVLAAARDDACDPDDDAVASRDAGS